MRLLFVLPLLVLMLWAAPRAEAQRTGFEIKAVVPSVVDTPDYNFSGDKKRVPRPGKWLEVEVEFETEPELTEELTLKYYILFSNKLLTGDVTHVNILKGSHFSVVYVAPNTIDLVTGGKALTVNSVENIGVEMLRQGQLVAVKSLKEARGPWWQQYPQTPGFVLNKNETPFAPLYWDRYEAIKSSR